MKLFGEYLVEKKIINPKQLVEALVKQNTLLPSIAQIALEKNLLEPDQILKVFKLQFEKKTGFLEAARELNLWTDQLHQDAEKTISSLRVPLGQILVESSSLTLEAITHALDDFMSEIAVPTPKSELLSSDKKEMLLGAIHLMKSGDVSFSPLKTVKDLIPSLVSAAKMNQATLSESVLLNIESIMDLIMKADIGKVDADLIVKTGTAIQQAVEMIAKTSESILAGKDEATVLSHSDLQPPFKVVSAALEMLKFDLEFL